MSRLRHITTLTRQEREARNNRPPYPMVRNFNFMTAITSRDTRLSVYFFGMFQLSILLLTLSLNSEHRTKLFIGSMLVAMIITIHGSREIRTRQRVKFRVRNLTPKRLLGVLVITYILMYGLSVAIHMLKIPIPKQANQEALELILDVYFIPMGFITVVVAPIVEELVFREYLPHAFGPSYASFIIYSIVFALLHSPTGLAGMLVYMSLSSIFLYIRLKDNNLTTSVLTHMGYNFISLIISRLTM